MDKHKTDHDVIIIGGGPAGLSAALWCNELGLKSVLFEKEKEFGGQLLATHNPVKNYLGIETSNGRELSEKFIRHLNSFNLPAMKGTAVFSVDLASKSVTLSNTEVHSADAIIIATGVRRRSLGVPGETEFLDRGVLRSGVESKDAVAGRDVVIVGGGDAAIENALILSKAAASVKVIHRRDQFTARSEFLDAARQLGNVEFIVNSEILAINGTEAVDAVEIGNLENGSRTIIRADAVLIRVGVLPNTELFVGQIEMDAGGYILVDALCAASLPAIFAAGDVANRLSPTISTAVGSGAAAAQAAHALLNSLDSV